VMLMHHPWATSGVYRRGDLNLNGRFDRVEFSEALLPLVHKHGVQLLLAGHDHTYERFLPVQGMHSVVTGGGGGVPYWMTEADPLSAQFSVRFHFVRLRFVGDRLTVQAVNQSGRVFDQFHIQRTPPPRRTHAGTWGTPRIEAETGPDDGNFRGQTFDFGDAEVIPSFTGRSANLGNLRVRLDAMNLYLGLESLMLPRGADAYLFVEVPGLPGVRSLAGLGNGRLDPSGEGIDALDLAAGLSFTNFTPSIAAVLGDEKSDGTARGFLRSGASNALGQGVFRLTRGFPSVPGIRLQQFNRSPQDQPQTAEDNADFVELAIPRSELGHLPAAAVIRVGAIVGLGPATNGFSREFDPGFLGCGLTATSVGVELDGLIVRLPRDPDTDRDGLDEAREIALGTDPMNADSDGDGLPDGWEVDNQLDPLSSMGSNGADGDPDGDGYRNGEELALGGDPLSDLSPLRLVVTDGAPDERRLTWRTVAGRTYDLRSSITLTSAFASLPGFPRRAAAAEDEVLLPLGPETRFFRLHVVTP
jgi:hypothetical protein